MTEMAMQSRKSKYGRSLFYPTLKKKSSANTNSKKHQISKKKKKNSRKCQKLFKKCLKNGLCFSLFIV